MHFDQLFGWELTLLEPGPFWAEVPDLLKPIYHFFNVPIQSGASDPQSPLRLIRWVSSGYCVYGVGTKSPRLFV